MRVLIIGGSGMLGSDLLAAFSHGYEVLGLDLPDLDITRADQCSAIIKKHQPGIVINAAALTKVDYCERHEQEALLVNGHGAGNLAQSTASAGAFFVHYSTDYVFDGLKEEPYLEEDYPHPKSIYGKSKLLGEELVRQHCPNHMIIRTSWLFGPNGANFIRTILKKAEQNETLQVVNDQKGSPTYSRDVAAHTVRMIEAGCRSTYHLTNTGYGTWYELAVKALEWAGIKGTRVRPVSTLEFPLPAPRPANSILANARLQRDGLPLMRPWHSAAQEYINQYLKPAILHAR